MVGELDGRGQHDCRAYGDRPEGQSLLHQVRLALAFPRPAGQNVTHRRASDPRRQCRLASSETRWAEADRQGDLACRDRSHRNQHETAEPLPKVAPEPTFRGRDNPGRCQNHVSPKLCGGRQVARPTGIHGTGAPEAGSGQPPVAPATLPRLRPDCRHCGALRLAYPPAAPASSPGRRARILPGSPASFFPAGPVVSFPAGPPVSFPAGPPGSIQPACRETCFSAAHGPPEAIRACP